MQTSCNIEGLYQEVLFSHHKTAIRCVFIIGSIDLAYCNLLYRELKKGLEGLILESNLHLLYLATPYDMTSNCSPDWMIYLKQVRIY